MKMYTDPQHEGKENHFLEIVKIHVKNNIVIKKLGFKKKLSTVK